MPRLSWEDRNAEDFASLVQAIPNGALQSPLRSVVPLVDLFRAPEHALIHLEKSLGIPMTTATELVFESALPVQQGLGKASYTDLLVLGPTVSAALEAKWTEPRYETVGEWLGPSPTANRQAVLGGWLSTIGSVIGDSIPLDSVLQLPYQVVHRAASACAPNVKERALVYLIFGSEPASYYTENLRKLDDLLGRPAALSVHVMAIALTGSPAFTSLVERWDRGERDLAGPVRDLLQRGPLFTFGEPIGLYRRASSLPAANEGVG